VLCLLYAGPLHPYGMQRLIKTWGKDEVVNVGQRANLYKTIKRLHEAGLIAVRLTERTEQYPERTVYELTDEGRRTALRWLAAMLGTPRNEYPAFPAALSFAMLLGPEAVADELSQRLRAIQARLDHLNAQIEGHPPGLPRITVIETEYQRAVTEAELRWVASVIDDLKSGKLSWDGSQFAVPAADDVFRATAADD
jgi:DNA-binding PadR family transcriptional regulator